MKKAIDACEASIGAIESRLQYELQSTRTTAIATAEWALQQCKEHVWHVRMPWEVYRQLLKTVNDYKGALDAFNEYKHIKKIVEEVTK